MFRQASEYSVPDDSTKFSGATWLEIVGLSKKIHYGKLLVSAIQGKLYKMTEGKIFQLATSPDMRSKGMNKPTYN